MIVYRIEDCEPTKSIDLKGYKCNLCCNQEKHLFHTYYHIGFEEEVTYCRCCMMGQSNCDIESVKIDQTQETLPFHLGFSLTPLQTKASQFILACFKDKKDCLINAVTGAGKTEMVIEAIHTARALGFNVALVSPRVDVVKELSLRMNQYLKQKELTNAYVSTLYGGHNTIENMHFIIATVHQLMKFKNYFHLIFIDEIDAFPMTTDQRLHRIINTSKHPSGMIVYLSATPPKTIEMKCKDTTIKIPMRFHQRPLPIPHLKFVNSNQFIHWIRSDITKNKKEITLYFFNHIEAMQSLFESLNMEGGVMVDASDIDRHEKVESIRKREYRYVFTTTILERGFTVEHLNVVVINSHLFTWDSLVQIAGRVDRKGIEKNGKVTFLHQGVSLSMLKALKYIQRMNQLRLQEVNDDKLHCL